jgi:N,N'-diacetylchitobiose transport system substrate-binding protein
LQVWDGSVSKLQTALASTASTPDIVEFGNTQVPTFSAVGALRDLTAIKSDLGGNNLTKSLVDLGTFDSRMYAAPFYAGSRIFYYRKDLFAAAGVAVPTTIDELTAAATSLQQLSGSSNPNFSAVYLPGISWQACLAWQFSNGGRLANQTGQVWAGGLSAPDSQKAFSQLQALWKTGSRSGQVTDGITAEQPWVPFNAGETAMFFGFNWHLGKIDETLVTSDKVGFFAFPAATPGGDSTPFAGGSNVAISANSGASGLAQDALKLIFSRPFQEYFATEGGWVPGNLKYASALGSSKLAVLTVDAVKTSVGTPAARNWALVEGSKIVDDFYVALGAGGDPIALARTADSKITTILNKS